jgi:hypothetical protein
VNAAERAALIAGRQELINFAREVVTTYRPLCLILADALAAADAEIAEVHADMRMRNRQLADADAEIARLVEAFTALVDAVETSEQDWNDTALDKARAALAPTGEGDAP